MRVIIEIISLDLFTCPYQVFINNHPVECIPQLELDAGSLIGIGSHFEMHDYIRPKKGVIGRQCMTQNGTLEFILIP